MPAFAHVGRDIADVRGGVWNLRGLGFGDPNQTVLNFPWLTGGEFPQNEVGVVMATVPSEPVKVPIAQQAETFIRENLLLLGSLASVVALFVLAKRR